MTDEKRVAIVTGASRGIGAGVAAAFLDAGYAVVANARSMAASTNPDLLAVAGDISDPGTAARVVEQGLDRFGRIDTLVNNAGIYLGKPFLDYSVSDLDAIISVNLVGFFHITQRAIAQMLAQGSGHVVNVTTSLVDHARSARPAALTSLTKGGLDAVTRALAVEYAARGVRVNAVSLGVIRTDVMGAAAGEAMAALHPLGRSGEIRDVAEGILYLERAAFVTGETLHIDGGQAAGH